MTANERGCLVLSTPINFVVLELDEDFDFPAG